MYFLFHQAHNVDFSFTPLQYSREFALAAIENKDGCVNDRVFKKLQIFRPPVELIDAYLDEIARTYKVPWNSGREKADLEADVPVGFQDGIEKEVQVSFCFLWECTGQEDYLTVGFSIPPKKRA